VTASPPSGSRWSALPGRAIAATSRGIAALGIAGGVALAFYNVVARYLFGASLTWAGELTIYLFLWSTFFGAAICFQEERHIAVNLLLRRAPPRWARRGRIAAHLVSLFFLAAVAWHGYRYLRLVAELGERSIDLDIPMWLPYLAIPVGFGFAAWLVLERLILLWRAPAGGARRAMDANTDAPPPPGGEGE